MYVTPLALRLGAEGTGGYQSSLSSAPFWPGVIDQPSVTTVTAASKASILQRAEELEKDMVAPFSATDEDLLKRDSWSGVATLMAGLLFGLKMKLFWYGSHINLIAKFLFLPIFISTTNLLTVKYNFGLPDLFPQLHKVTLGEIKKQLGERKKTFHNFEWNWYSESRDREKIRINKHMHLVATNEQKNYFYHRHGRI